MFSLNCYMQRVIVVVEDNKDLGLKSKHKYSDYFFLSALQDRHSDSNCLGNSSDAYSLSGRTPCLPQQPSSPVLSPCGQTVGTAAGGYNAVSDGRNKVMAPPLVQAQSRFCHFSTSLNQENGG